MILTKYKQQVFIKYLTELDDKLCGLKFVDYGNDLVLILVQFHLFPNEKTANIYRNVEYYRPKEKSIGLNIIIDDQNFFDKSHNDQISFLDGTIMQRIEELGQRIHKKSLDMDINKLKIDIYNALRVNRYK